MSETTYTITGKSKLKLVRNFLKDQDRNKRVLCVGGTKYDLRFVRRIGFRKVLVSNNSKTELEGCGNNAIFFDITKTPPGIGKFDIIICMDVLEHLIDTDAAIINMNKLLKEGGALIITTPNLSCFFNRVFLLFGWSLPNYTPANIKTGNPIIKAKISTSFRNSFSHKSVFTQKQLKELLTVYGFKVIKEGGFHYGSEKSSAGGGHYNTLRKVLNKVLPASMREGIFLVCKKEKFVEPEEVINNL